MDCFSQMKNPDMRKGQRGITLIETMGALAIASSMLIGLTIVIDNSLEDMKGQQAALYQSQVANAARKYLAANYAQIVLGVQHNTTMAVSIDTLKSQKLLPSGFATSNVYGQASCVLIRPRPSLNPDPKLDALVVTYGGTKIEDKDIAAVALNAGIGSGYIRTASPTTAQGASWQLATTSYRGLACTSGGTTVLTGSADDGGHLVNALFYEGSGQLSTDFVYRDAVPGRPELNQMNTPLLMASNALVTRGTACGSNPALAIDSATRTLMSCGADGLWKNATSSQWKDPVAAYGSLPTTNSQVGDVRMVTDIKRAFTYDGASWVAMAVDQDGNFTVPQKLVVGGDASIQHDLAIGNNVQANSVYGLAYVQGGYLRSDTFTESGEVNLYHQKNAGDACNIPVIDNGVAVHAWPTGTVLLDASGLPLICANDAVFRYANGTFSP